MKKSVNILFIGYVLLYALALALVIGMVGCKTTCPLAIGELIVKDSVIEKHDTITIPIPPIVLPGDTVKLLDTVPCPDVQWRGNAKSRSGRMQLTAEINKGRLSVDCKTDSLLRELDRLKAIVKTKDHYREKISYQMVKVKEPYVPLWVWIVVVVCVGTILVLLFKR